MLTNLSYSPTLLPEGILYDLYGNLAVSHDFFLKTWFLHDLKHGKSKKPFCEILKKNSHFSKGPIVNLMVTNHRYKDSPRVFHCFS